MLLQDACPENALRETSGLQESEVNGFEPTAGVLVGQHVSELKAGNRVHTAGSMARIDAGSPNALLEPLGVFNAEREGLAFDHEYVHHLTLLRFDLRVESRWPWSGPWN